MATKRQYIKMVDPKKLIIVGLDTDDTETHHLWDERARLPLDENLVKNITALGVLQPITIIEEAGKMFVVDGRQRVRAARKAAEQQSDAGEFEMKVPVTTHGTEGDQMRLTGVMISANEQRREDTIMAKAMKAAQLKNQGAAMDYIALIFGKTPATVKIWLKLLQADRKLHDAVDEGLIAWSAVKELLSFPKEEQVNIFNELLRQNNGERVTMAQIQAFKNQVGASNKGDGTKAQATSGGENNVLPLATPLAPLPPVTRPTGRSGPRNQAGVLRSWLRKALNTKAAEKLDSDKFGVLNWVAHGTGDVGWWNDFEAAAEAEMSKE